MPKRAPYPEEDFVGGARIGSKIALDRTRMSQHLVIVDDEPQIRDLLSMYLVKQGYRVSTAADSAELEKILGVDPVDLVVLDIGLAEEDGLRVLDQLKTNRPGLLVVMLTGMGFVEDLLQEAHQKGADGYVSKALPLEELLLTIQRTLTPEDAAGAC